MDAQLPASPHHEIHAKQNGVWLVRATENILLAPRCRQVVKGRLDTEKGQEFPPLFCKEPALTPLQGILPARVLSRVESSARKPSQVTSQDVHSTTGTSRSCVYVTLSNFSSESLTVRKSTVLGIAEGDSETLVDRVNAGSQTSSGKVKTKALYKKLLGET